jgi:hypothetical protein
MQNKYFRGSTAVVTGRALGSVHRWFAAEDMAIVALDRLTEQDWRSVLDVNVMGTV